MSVGIVQETIANNATGRVLLSGYAALVNVPACVTRGHYVETHTVAKQATGNSTRRSGSFGQFLTGGTTPTAVLWGTADQTASGGGGLTVEEVDGSPTDSAVTKIVFPNGTLGIASHVATYTPALGWNLDVNQSGASFAAWAANTSDGGAWSSNGTEIIQTNTGAAPRRARLSAQTPLGWPTIIQCDGQVVSSSGGVNRFGIGITDGTSGGLGFITRIDTGADSVGTELDSQVNLSLYSMTLAETTWYTLRMVINGLWISVYVDGTFKGNAIMSVGGTAAPKNSVIDTNFLTLLTYGASVKFRNIKVWSLSTGAP